MPAKKNWTNNHSGGEKHSQYFTRFTFPAVTLTEDWKRLVEIVPWANCCEWLSCRMNMESEPGSGMCPPHLHQMGTHRSSLSHPQPGRAGLHKKLNSSCHPTPPHEEKLHHKKSARAWHSCPGKSVPSPGGALGPWLDWIFHPKGFCDLEQAVRGWGAQGWGRNANLFLTPLVHQSCSRANRLKLNRSAEEQ